MEWRLLRSEYDAAIYRLEVAAREEPRLVGFGAGASAGWLGCGSRVCMADITVGRRAMHSRGCITGLDYTGETKKVGSGRGEGQPPRRGVEGAR